MKLFTSRDDNPYDLVNDDGLDAQVPVHPEEAFDHGIRFDARYVGSLDVPKPASRVEIVAAMRRVRFQFKIRHIPKRDVSLVVSTRGIRVTDRNDDDEDDEDDEIRRGFGERRRRLFHWIRKRRTGRRKSVASDETFDADDADSPRGAASLDASPTRSTESPDAEDGDAARQRRRRHRRRPLPLMSSPVNRVFYVSHDSLDLKIFSYIAQENEADSFSADAIFRCHVFKSRKQLEAMRIVRTIGQAFEVCHNLNQQRQQQNLDEAASPAGDVPAVPAAVATTTTSSPVSISAVFARSNRTLNQNSILDADGKNKSANDDAGGGVNGVGGAGNPFAVEAAASMDPFFDRSIDPSLKRGIEDGEGDDASFDPSFNQPYETTYSSTYHAGETTTTTMSREDSQWDIELTQLFDVEEAESMKSSSLLRHLRLLRMEVMSLKEERLFAASKRRRLEALVEAERRSRAEDEQRLANLTRLNSLLMAQVRSLTKELDALTLQRDADPFAAAATSHGVKPAVDASSAIEKSKSYDDGFQSANSFVSSDSQSPVDEPLPPIGPSVFGPDAGTLKAKARVRLDQCAGDDDDNIYELRGDVSPDSGRQSAL